MFKKSKLVAIISAITALAILAAACSPAAPKSSSEDIAAEESGGSSGDNTITVWYFDKVSMETAIPMFEKAHPGVKVKFVQQPFGDMAKKYLAALAAKTGVPDVIGLDTSMVGRFLDAGEDLLDSPYNAEQFRDQFVEWKFDAPITKNGEMSAFPWDVATGVMFYRPDVFKQAGLPTEPEEVAKALSTWDAYIKAGQQITEKTGGQSAIVGNEHDLFNVSFWQNGGSIVEGDKIAFVSQGAAGIELAMKAREAKVSANVSAWSERWFPSLKTGKIATIVMGAWMLGNLQHLIDPEGAGKWRITTAPGGAFDNGGTYLQIPKLAKNKALAWEFVRFLTTNPDVQNAVFQKTGIVPALKSAWNSPLYNEPVAYLGGQKAWKLLVELAQQVKPLHYSSVDSLGVDLLNAQVDAAIAGKVSAKDALKNAANQLQERAARVSDLKLTIPAG